MSDLRELYQEVILDHARTPRNFGKPDKCNCEAEGYNPLCGDRVTIYLHVEDDIIQEVCFEGTGCAISLASASLMTEMLKGKSVDQARALFGRFHDAMAGDGADNMASLDKLAVLSGVREFPMRVKCATLPWHTFTAALNQDEGTVATE